MIVRVHRPTRILADEGLHAVSTAEAARLVAIGAATIFVEPEIQLPVPDPDPDQEKKPVRKKKTTAKKKSTTTAK